MSRLFWKDDVPVMKQVIFRRDKDSQIEAGVLLAGRHSKYNRIFSGGMVEEILPLPQYFYVCEELTYNTVRCNKFITFQDRLLTGDKLVIFDAKEYPLISRDIDGIVVLDEQLFPVTLKYRGIYYHHFQQ